MKTRTLLGIICICLQLISFIGNSNSGPPIKLSFDSLELFLFDLFYLFGYCFIGIIGVILIIWGAFSKNNKAKQHAKNQINKDINKESKVVDMIQEKTNSFKNDVINSLVCPKCNVNVPNDSVFCPNCGCDIEKEKKQTFTEQEEKPEIKVVEKVVEKVIIKKNKTNKFLAVFLILSLIVSSVLGYFAFTYYQQSNNYSKEVKELTDSNKILTNRYDETSIARDTLRTLNLQENWGCATKNFFASTGVVIIDSYSGSEITIFHNYNDVTLQVYTTDSDIADPYWVKDKGKSTLDIILEKYTGTDTDANYRFFANAPSSAQLYIKALKPGVSTITITNNKNAREIKLLVIVVE